MTQNTVLDTAGFFDTAQVEHSVVQSLPADGIVHTHVRNGDLGNRMRRRFELRWQPATLSMTWEIRDHYTVNAHAAFVLNLPGGGAANVIYAEPPRIQQQTALSADVSVVLEEALITD